MTRNDTQQHGARSFGRAIYYPFFSIQDVNWLKAALLYWDEISCIVPHGYTTTEPEELKPAGEFTLSLDPRPYTKRAEVVFRQSILPLVEQSDQTQGQAMLKSVADAIGDRRGWVHANKMTQGLRGELEGRGILQHGPDQRMFLDQGFDALYMTCLAKEMGIATSRPPLTDAKEYAACEALLQFGADPPAENLEADQAGGPFLIQLGIALPSPQQLAHIPLETIVEHHRKRQDERRAFRRAVEAITAEVSEVTDPTALTDRLTDQKRAIETQVANYRKTLDEINDQAIASVLDISVPAWGMTAVGASVLAGTGVGVVLAGLGLTIKVVKWWAKVRHDRREAVASCPWHYWMDTQREFERA